MSNPHSCRWIGRVNAREDGRAWLVRRGVSNDFAEGVKQCYSYSFEKQTPIMWSDWKNDHPPCGGLRPAHPNILYKVAENPVRPRDQCPRLECFSTLAQKNEHNARSQPEHYSKSIHEQNAPMKSPRLPSKLLLLRRRGYIVRISGLPAHTIVRGSQQGTRVYCTASHQVAPELGPHLL